MTATAPNHQTTARISRHAQNVAPKVTPKVTPQRSDIESALAARVEAARAECARATAFAPQRADDATLFQALLPEAGLYVPALIADFLGIDEDSVTRHARNRPARFAKHGGRWQWETRDDAAKFCAYLVAVSWKAKTEWGKIRERFGNASEVDTTA